MLQVIRDRATGWIAYTIIILICIPFVLWGVNSYFGNPAIPDVAFVGGDAISQQDFQRAYQQSRARAPNADDALLKQQVLQQLIDRQLLEQTANNLDFRLSDQQLDITIRA
ncbi:MAG: SurA N-terminal domain-containing protein [Gammaproteobacteria bacterium]